MAMVADKGGKGGGPLEMLNHAFPDGLTLAEHLAAGAFATGCAVFAMHPMDTIKTYIQKVQPAGDAVKTKSLNMFSAGIEIFSKLGPLSFYKGVGPNVAGQAPAGAIKFSVFEGLSKLADAKLFATEKLGTELRPAVDLLCAALAYCACSVVLVPGEVLKQRLQAGMYSGVGDGVAKILQTEGLRGFYTGFGATLARDVPYTMLEFGLYHQYKRMLRYLKGGRELTGIEELLMGGLAGGCTGFLTTPLDVAKTKLMTQGTDVARYNNFMQAMTAVRQSEGTQALFTGAAVRVIWLIPFTAIYFGVHENSKRFFKQRQSWKTGVCLG